MNFDAALALSPVTAAYLLAHATRAPLRAGIVYTRRPVQQLLTRFLLTRRQVVDIEGKLKRDEPVPHDVSKMLGLLSSLGVPRLFDDLSLVLDPESVPFIGKTLSRWERPIGLHLSPNWLRQGWKMADLADLIGRIKERFQAYPVVMTYGGAEAELGKEMEQRFADAPHIGVIGGLNFQGWAALLGQCRVLVSTDTGAVHVAAAQKVPVLVVYLKQTYTLCSQQWEPWKVPHVQIQMGDCSETRNLILEGLERLLVIPRQES